MSISLMNMDDEIRGPPRINLSDTESEYNSDDNELPTREPSLNFPIIHMLEIQVSAYSPIWPTTKNQELSPLYDETFHLNQATTNGLLRQRPLAFTTETQTI